MKKFIIGFSSASLLFLIGIGVFCFVENRAIHTDYDISVEVDNVGHVKINGEDSGTVIDVAIFRDKLKQTIEKRRIERAAALEQGDSKAIVEGRFTENIVLKFPPSFDDDISSEILKIAAEFNERKRLNSGKRKVA